MELPSPKVIMIVAGMVFIGLTVTDEGPADGKNPKEWPCCSAMMPLPRLPPQRFGPLLGSAR